jgi:hypothetical protein
MLDARVRVPTAGWEPMPKYEVRLVGKQAKLGDVAMVDVARLMFDVQTLIARAAGVAIGRRPKPTGRWEGTIEEATRLRLVKIKRGSVILEVRGPRAVPDEGELDLSVESLADLGWSTAMSTLNNAAVTDDPDVLRRLLSLANGLSIGGRYEAIEFRTDGTPVARLDEERRERLRSVVERRQEPLPPPPAVSGVLFEADFERHTAKVRTQDGNVVDLIFEPDQSGTIKEALRERSQFQGDVTFDPVTNSVKSIRLRRITRFEQLLLGTEGGESFWNALSFGELSGAQGTGTVESFDELRDTSLSDDEFQQYVDTLS